ncbi:LLM class flavin-dependent oxidoreductase [Flavisphingomonas formosensis]|uniref:LLM class flavin-dependent oxidoreductase n=1 Tax=Flavisphingomonas formosensis TaxID=861534 RepID=UPI0012F91BA4|nr:LLM class flavin-dependent oxidoreductase [Sphingomonas formosensis]
MKFSIIYEAQLTDTSRESEHQMFQDMIEQVKLAEELGFDCIWAVEHHALTQYAHMSAPETFLAFVAGMTKRIHVGHGVVCLPYKMNHPAKVAERVAMLDQLSNGRVHFGVGKGGTDTEAGLFGHKVSEIGPMVDEAMYLIPKIFVNEEIEHEGEYIQIPRRAVWPKPYQDPHPPMYMACSREDSLLTAGERGIGALVMGFTGPEEIARKNKIYRDAFANRKPEDQVGFRPTQHLAALCPAVILEDRDQARRMGLRGQRFFIQAIEHFYRGGPAPVIEDLSFDEQMALLEKDKENLVTYLGEEKIEITDLQTGNYHVEQDAYGTIDNAINYVQRLVNSGADEILFLVQMGTIPHWAIMETIRNLGETLIPHFRNQAEAAAAPQPQVA